jgi:hypothetical protein
MCKYCGSKDGCKPVGGSIGMLMRMGTIDVDAFKQLYWSMLSQDDIEQIKRQTGRAIKEASP